MMHVGTYVLIKEIFGEKTMYWEGHLGYISPYFRL